MIRITTPNAQSRPCGKESTEVRITQKIGNEGGNSCRKSEKISG